MRADRLEYTLIGTMAGWPLTLIASSRDMDNGRWATTVFYFKHVTPAPRNHDDFGYPNWTVNVGSVDGPEMTFSATHFFHKEEFAKIPS
ncbi:MAG: hypothetical protein JNK33_03425 [Candidatus Doudnabacteria bacterium]|nr:hypothetical protein [Candidatus Doudnabacteria bacterium]